MAFLTLQIETDTDFPVGELQNRFDLSARGKHEVLRAIKNHLNGVAGGQHRAILGVQVNTAAGTGTITCDTSAATAGTTTLTVAGQAFTTVTAAATPSITEIVLAATDAGLATNVAARINSHATTNHLLRATASAAVVTVTARSPGTVGNLITLAEAAAGFVVSGAVLTGGAGDEMDDYDFGHT